MRVLFWSEPFKPYLGGAEVLGARLVPALRARGHELVVVTRGDSAGLPDESDLDGVPVHRFPFVTAVAERNFEQLAQARRRLAELKRAFRPELVHLYFVGPSAVFHHQTAAAHPAPLLVSLHSTKPDRFIGSNTVLGSALRSAGWVTACSGAVLRETRRQLPRITPYSSVVWNSLAPPAVLPEPLPFDPPRLLCLGRLIPQKGFDVTLAAFARLVPERPDLRLIIAGDGPERTTLERQAGRLGLAELVDFVGWVAPDEVPTLINASTIVIMPSRSEEAFGLVALQAAQQARPIVATRVGGLPEVVLHRETGLLVERDDSRALAEAVASLLDQPDAAQRIGEAARSRALETFSWERHVDAYDGLYRKLVGAGFKPALARP